MIETQILKSKHKCLVCCKCGSIVCEKNLTKIIDEDSNLFFIAGDNCNLERKEHTLAHHFNSLSDQRYVTVDRPIAEIVSNLFKKGFNVTFSNFYTDIYSTKIAFICINSIKNKTKTDEYLSNMIQDTNWKFASNSDYFNLNLDLNLNTIIYCINDQIRMTDLDIMRYRSRK